MKALLDTHAFLWFSLDDSRLSTTARAFMANRDNELLISPASLWEIAIKVSLGKYIVHEPLSLFFERQISENELVLLPFTARHAATVSGLPFRHRDPFDRLLAAQALCEEVPIISSDKIMDQYSLPRVW